MMRFTYAVPDLHGRFDLFERAVAGVLAHAGDAAASVVTLGDYVDRGPASRQIVEYLMRWDHPTLRLISLKGNHEAMMWQACNGLLEPERWMVNGGDATLASYGADPQNLRDAIPDAHLAWLNDLPLLHVDSHRVFVHGGVDPLLPLDRQQEATLLWKRYPAKFRKGYGRYHVVHGHDGTRSAPVVTTGKTNLDSLAWRTGRLVVGVYDDDRGGAAVDYITVAGSPAVDCQA